ncbi:hypothetical protein KIN20_001760, partial [Parelaphostrongylus tenuis]
MSTHGKCANYLQCRGDEMEKRWMCHSEEEVLVTRVCQLREHLKIILNTTENCNKTLVSPSNENQCQKQADYLEISQLLLSERKEIVTLLRACRSKIYNIGGANITRNHREAVMKVLSATKAIMYLITDLKETSSTRTVVHKSAPKRVLPEVSRLNFTVNRANSSKILVLPKSFLPRMSYTTKKNMKPFVHFDTKALDHYSFLQSTNTSSKQSESKEFRKPLSSSERQSHSLVKADKKPRIVAFASRPYHNVDLVIDRSFMSHPQFHEQPLVPPTASFENSRVDGFEQRAIPPLQPGNIAPQYVLHYPLPNDPLHQPTLLLKRPLRLRRLLVMRPLAPQSHRVKHGVNRLTKGSLRKVGLKSHRNLSTPLNRPAVPFKSSALRFTSDTSTISNLGFPYKNRLTRKRRIQGKSFIGQSSNVDASTFSSHPVEHIQGELRTYLQSTPDEIYEDILHQQQDTLSNNVVSSDVDFDDCLFLSVLTIVQRRFQYLLFLIQLTLIDSGELTLPPQGLHFYQ